MEIYKIIILILVSIVIYLLFNNIIKKPVKIKKILAHRGYNKIKQEENSIKSVSDAIKLNFKGVEIDVFYDDVRKDLLCSHDGYSDPHTELSLDELLKIDCPACFDKFIFWIDIKNLTIQNVFDCIKKINEYENKYNNKYIFIESQNYICLSIISCLTNTNTSYWIEDWEELLLPNFFTFTSMSFGIYDRNPKIYELLSKNPIHLFTIDNKDKLKSYYSSERISILLTDTDVNEENLFVKF